MIKELSTLLRKFYFPSPVRRPLRCTLLELHTTGILQVSRRHSLLHLWAPQREFFRNDESFAD